MKSIIKILAEENGVTPTEIERDLKEVVAMADSQELQVLRSKLGRELTVEEFVLFCADKAQAI